MPIQFWRGGFLFLSAAGMLGVLEWQFIIHGDEKFLVKHELYPNTQKQKIIIKKRNKK